MGFFYLIDLEEEIKLINGTKRYFISNLGYCYKESKTGFRKTMIDLNIINGVPKVKIESRKLSIVLLLVEHFYEGELKNNTRYVWKLVDGKVPFDKIKINSRTFSDTDETLMFQYRVDSRVSGSNKRVNNADRITKEDVLNVLKRSNLHCFYCGEKLKTKHWHLDHVVPLSKGGRNIITNLAAACKTCNIMKGALDYKAFVDKCQKITENENKQNK